MKFDENFAIFFNLVVKPLRKILKLIFAEVQIPNSRHKLIRLGLQSVPHECVLDNLKRNFWFSSEEKLFIIFERNFDENTWFWILEWILAFFFMKFFFNLGKLFTSNVRIVLGRFWLHTNLLLELLTDVLTFLPESLFLQVLLRTLLDRVVLLIGGRRGFILIRWVVVT